MLNWRFYLIILFPLLLSLVEFIDLYLQFLIFYTYAHKFFFYSSICFDQLFDLSLSLRQFESVLIKEFLYYFCLCIFILFFDKILYCLAIVLFRVYLNLELNINATNKFAILKFAALFLSLNACFWHFRWADLIQFDLIFQLFYLFFIYSCLMAKPSSFVNILLFKHLYCSLILSNFFQIFINLELLFCQNSFQLLDNFLIVSSWFHIVKKLLNYGLKLHSCFPNFSIHTIF